MCAVHQTTARRNQKRASSIAIVWYLIEKCGVLCKVGGTNEMTLIVSTWDMVVLVSMSQTQAVGLITRLPYSRLC
jgi:hypothetical protein